MTTFTAPVNATWTMPDTTPQSGKRVEVTAPDGTSNKIYFIGSAAAEGWRRGLPALVETYTGSTWRRKVMTTWTQDNTSVSYPLNPRVTETNIYDPEGNRARTQVTYQQFTFADGTSCHLPRDVYEYAAEPETILRSTRTDYNTSTSYTGRHILGLVSEKRLYEGNVNSGGTLMSKASFSYDGSGSIQGTDVPVQHDNTNYSASLVTGRANLSSVKRYDVTDTTVFTVTKTAYNTAGAVVSSKDALDHETKIGYGDSFSDGNTGRNTLAYPIVVTDADNYSSTAQYNFDFGAVTRRQTPQPNKTENDPGPEQSWTFDTIGRLQRVTNLVNNAYTRFEYPTSQIRVDTYTTIQEGLGEAHSFGITDGLGRVVATATDHPGSDGGYSGQRFVYDAMGRVIKTSNPTETSASGAPSQWITDGDDENAGWIYVQQTYDWKGRPLVTTNQDGTTRSASYSGCGCAGGEVVTLTDEGTMDGGVAKRRQQKIYSDVLGRTRKQEVLNWENGSPYSTTVNTYNARDQVTRVREHAGVEGSSTFQDTTMSYDGFARLQTVHRPEQQPQPNNTASSDHTTFHYNPDDTVAYTIDARGVKKSFSYNQRHLVTSVSYDLSLIPPAHNFVNPTSDQTFAYDAAGNRTSMTDGTGTIDYHYNWSSQLSSETRTFAGPLSGTSFTLTYSYNLAGEIKSLALPSQFGTSLTYNYDPVGRLTDVTGSGYTYTGSSNSSVPVSTFLSNAVYRAWNDLKQVNTGSGSQTGFTYDQQLRPTSYNLVAGSLAYSWNYEYYPDGKVKMASDASNDHFDKGYTYDHVGRMKEAYSGREARGLPSTTPTPDSPYRQSFTYSAFNQHVGETGRIWQRQLSGQVFSYTNNRRQDLLYDAEGHVTSDAQGNHVFDAAGERVFVTAGTVGGEGTGHSEMPAEERSVAYDADGQPVKSVIVTRTEILIGGGPQTTISSVSDTTYYLRSTALGGYVVGELNAQGQKTKQYVYAGGERLAEQWSSGGSTTINWQHRNPLTDSWVSFDPNGAFSFRTEVDAHGRETGLEPPAILSNEPPPPPTRDPSYLEMQGGPTIEAELGQQLYEDIYINKIFDRGNGPGEGAFDRLRTIRQFQLTIGGTFLLGLGRFDALDSVTGYEQVDDYVKPGWEKGEQGLEVTYFRLKPGFRQRTKFQGRSDTAKKVQQNTLIEDDPETISSTGSKNCKFTISFQSGTFYENNRRLPNGPGEIVYGKRTYFGLGFTVSGNTLGGGGIGRIGNQTNPSNPRGAWTLDQYTSSYAKLNGEFVEIGGKIQNGGYAWQDIDLTGYHFATEWTNRFSRYDHPALLANVPDAYKNQSFLIKVFKGNEECRAEFHMVQRGNTVHWGRGGQGIWPQ